jgi:hypothetical protein
VHRVARLALAASVVASLALPAAHALAYCENNETNPCEPTTCDKLAAIVNPATGRPVIICPQG